MHFEYKIGREYVLSGWVWFGVSLGKWQGNESVHMYLYVYIIFVGPHERLVVGGGSLFSDVQNLNLYLNLNLDNFLGEHKLFFL